MATSAAMNASPSFAPRISCSVNVPASIRCPGPPGQILLVLGIMRLGDSLSEGILRLPFALLGVVAAATLALLARSRLRLHLCALAGILLITQGVLLEMSRWIQYQVFVLAMMQLALYCAWRGWATRHTSSTMRYWLLAAFFSAAGLLGHFDAAWMVPALTFLFLRAQTGPLLSRRTLRRAIAVVVVGLLLCVPFYYSYLSYPGVLDSITAAEIGGRVGLNAAPFNHFGDYLLDMWDFDSAYRASVVLGLIAIGAIAAMLRAQSPFRLWLAALVTACIGGVLLSALQGNAFIFGGVNYAFVPFVILFAVMAWRLVRDPFWFAVLLWAFAVFGFTNFLMASPFDQYFLGLPALVLFACQGLSECWPAFRDRFPSAHRPLAVGAARLAA
jgi:Dolichyl-phosphate-mannose-protein mannosyltransferase